MTRNAAWYYNLYYNIFLPRRAGGAAIVRLVGVEIWKLLDRVAQAEEAWLSIVLHRQAYVGVAGQLLCHTGGYSICA